MTPYFFSCRFTEAAIYISCPTLIWSVHLHVDCPQICRCRFLQSNETACACIETLTRCYVHASFAQVYSNSTLHSHLHSGASERLFLLRIHRIHPLVSSASYFNPVSWVKEKFAPSVNEAQSEEKIQAAKDQAKKEGTANLFEEVQTITPPKPKPKDHLQKRADGSHKKKKKPDSVRIFVSSK